jgi:hypothetical protein
MEAVNFWFAVALVFVLPPFCMEFYIFVHFHAFYFCSMGFLAQKIHKKTFEFDEIIPLLAYSKSSQLW